MSRIGITQPKELKINLYPHQLSSIWEMERLETEKKIETCNCTYETTLGIFSDITGYGKTLSMVSLILRDKMEWDDKKVQVIESYESYAQSKIKIKTKKYLERNNTNILLCDTSIVHQWEKEFSYTPLKIVKITKKKDIEIRTEDYDVIILTPRVFNDFLRQYYGICWKRFIFDEPSSVRVSNMKTINSNFTWFITATPHGIRELHKSCKSSYMGKLVRDIPWDTNLNVFDSIIIKNSKEFIEESFKMPPTEHIYHQCKSPLLKIVNGMVSDKVLEMIDASNIDGAIQALGGGDKTCNIKELIKNRKLEDLEEVDMKIKRYERRQDERNLKIWCDKKKRIVSQIEELDQRYNEYTMNNCNICCDIITNPVMEPNCQNIFCAGCLMKWIKNKKSCPLCRIDIEPKNLVYIVKDEKVSEKLKEKATKQEKIIEIIRNKGECGKFIIYSNWDKTFDTIKAILLEADISFAEIKGSEESIKNNIDSFTKGEIRVIFLNSKRNGAGLNLIEATDLIIYHKMSDDIMTQILGRPNRIGRKESLIVHHFV